MIYLISFSRNKRGRDEDTTHLLQVSPCSLTVALEALGVVPDPGSLPRTTLDAVGTVSLLAEATSVTSGTGQATALAVFVDRVHDPVDTGVVTDLLVCRIDHDNLVVLHCSILVDPVRVQNTQVGISTSSLLFCNTLQVTFELQMVNTLVLGFTKDHTTMILTLTSTTTDTSTNNDETLLGLVPKTVCLFGTCRSVARVDVGTLTVLPGTDTQQKAHGVTLLVTPDLFHVLVRTHD